MAMTRANSSQITHTTVSPAINTTVETELQFLRSNLFSSQVSVKSFGAVGDGIVDDTAAIQTAINVLSAVGKGGVVFFPAGIYKVTSNISITWPNGADANAPAHVSLQGEGADITYIYDYRPGSPVDGCITIDFSAAFGSRYFDCVMGGFTLVKKVNDTTINVLANTYNIGTGVGIYMNSVPTLGSFDNIRIVGYETCVKMVDCLGVTFNNLMMYGCDIGVSAYLNVNSEPTVLTFNECTVAAYKSAGFLITGGGPVRFNGGIGGPGGVTSGSSQGVSACIFYIATNFITTQLVVDGMYFERCVGAADIYITAGTQANTRAVSNISNCFFARNDSTLLVTNNILVNNTSSTASLIVNTSGNGFKGYSPYVANAARRYIATSGAFAANITINGLGNFYNDAVEAPTVVTNIAGSGGGQDLQSVTAIGAVTTINTQFNGVNIGTFSATPSITTIGTTIGIGNSTNAVALTGNAWSGSGNNTNDLGAVSKLWNNVYATKYNIGAGTANITAAGNNIVLNGVAAAVPAVGFSPSLDNSYQLGAPSLRWTTVYAVTGTINTSDANQKQQIEELSQSELQAANRIRKLVKKFKFNSAVAEKGSNARFHIGVIAQEVQQAFEQEGLNPNNYGIFCSDVLEDGTVQLGIRYDELLAFVIASI